MTGSVAAIPRFQFSNATGSTLINGTVTTYLAGSTTPEKTYQNRALTTDNTNPIVLDGRGECVIWLDNAKSYKFVVKNSAGVTQWTQDDILGSATAESLSNYVKFVDLSAPTGTSLIGHGSENFGDILTNSLDKVVSSIAALRLLDTTKFTKATTIGYWAAGDSDGAPYYVDSADITSVDNGGTIIVTNSGARLKMIAPSLSSVDEFGAKGDGVTDDVDAIRAQMAVRYNGWAIVRFRAGKTYYVNGNIVVPSKTVFYFEDGAKIQLSGSTQARFFNSTPGVTAAAGLYDLTSDIYFFGRGIIDCNDASGAIGFAHATDIWVEGLTFQHGKNTHFIEINSSKNVTFRNVTFQNMPSTDGGLHEMLQFDYSNSVGFPSFGPYDNTPCMGVTVENCVFRDGHSGVASHANPAAQLHTKIRILNNQVYNMTACGIRAQGWGYGSVVEGNYLEDCGDKPMLVVGNVDGCDFFNNTVNRGGTTTTGAFWFSISGGVYPSRVNIVENRVYDVAGEGFYIAGVNFGDVTRNEVYRASKRGFYLANGTHDVNVFKNKVYACGGLTANAYDAYYIEDGCINNRIENNMARTMSAATTYRFGVSVQAVGAIGNRVNWNDIEAGSGAIFNDAGTLTEYNGETFLTATLAQTTGTITLRDDITKYQQVRVATGTTGANFYTDEARGWSTSGFRVLTDNVNVRTISGTAVMSIPTTTSLLIAGTASDAVRYVIGVGRT